MKAIKGDSSEVNGTDSRRTIAKAKSTQRTRHRLYVEVLQNGSSLLAVHLPIKRRGHLALTSQGRGPFVVPHYPLSDGRLEFLRFVPGGVELDVDHRWEGFCTSKGELITLKRQSRGRHQVLMQLGDYASVTESDLRIMIKLAPLGPRTKSAMSGTNPAYRKPMLSLVFASRLELQMGLLGLLMTSILIGGALTGLLNRPYHRSTKLSEVAAEYALPFIAPDHLRTAPEALQEHLDRRHPVASIMSYYEALTAALMGWHVDQPKWVDSSTTSLYQALSDDAHKILAAKVGRQQEIDHLQAMKDGVAILSIPSVLGESSSGSMRRVIDKIDILQRGFDMSLVARGEIQKVFPADQDYAWQEYRNIRHQDPAQADSLAKIHVFHNLSDEEMMYAEAAALGREAKAKQRGTLSHHRGKLGIPQDDQGPIAIPEGVRYASFTTGSDLRLADEKLYHIQASEYGSPSQNTPTVREPLIGDLEPPLIERYIKENRFQLQLCYELALRRNDQAAGMMEWKWRIDSRGAIADVALIASSIQDPRMTECIRQKIMTWRFPRPRHGSVEVSYPFEFAPTKG